MKSRKFGASLKQLFDELKLGQGRYRWYREVVGGDDSELRRWFRGAHPPSEANWKKLVENLLANKLANPHLENKIASLDLLLFEVREQRARRRFANSRKASRKSPHGGAVRANVELSAGSKSSVASGATSKPIKGENLACKKMWSEKTTTPFHQAVDDNQWSWAAEPFIPGRRIRDFQLFYHRSVARYNVPKYARKPFDRWCASATDAARLLKEPWGLQVRIERAQFNHRNHNYEIHLSPSKFLFYKAVQNNLGEPEYRPIRERAFENALYGLDRGERLVLPSSFAIHMLVVSSDGSALLRQRSNRTPLYRLAWEAGIGEFMHGPNQTNFPHFTRDGQPSLSRYLQNAVAEELDYRGARADHFRIYGFAAEYLTLAPKLMVVYSSDSPIADLMTRARHARDRASALASIPLTINGVASTLVNPKYRRWGPTSKLALLLGLLDRYGSDSVVAQLNARRNQLRAGRMIQKSPPRK